MTAYVYEAIRAIVADNVGAAAIEVVDDAEDVFLVAGDDAGTENDGVAFVDAGVLVVVDGSSRERTHWFTLRAADEEQKLLRRIVAQLPRIDDQAWGNVEVSEVLCDFARFHHGTAHNGDFAAMLSRQLEGDANAIDGGRKTGGENLLFGL